MVSTLSHRLSGRATVHLILEEIITSNLTVNVAHGTQEYTSSILFVGLYDVIDVQLQNKSLLHISYNV